MIKNKNKNTCFDTSCPVHKTMCNLKAIYIGYAQLNIACKKGLKFKLNAYHFKVEVTKLNISAGTMYSRGNTYSSEDITFIPHYNSIFTVTALIKILLSPALLVTNV